MADLEVRNHELLERRGDDAVALEVEITGTHTGPLRAPGARCRPRRRAIDLPAANLRQLRDERIASYHIYFDQTVLMTQLGLIPEPSGSGLGEGVDRDAAAHAAPRSRAGYRW